MLAALGDAEELAAGGVGGVGILGVVGSREEHSTPLEVIASDVMHFVGQPGAVVVHGGSAHCEFAVLRGREDVGAAAVGEVAVRTHCSEIVCHLGDGGIAPICAGGVAEQLSDPVRALHHGEIGAVEAGIVGIVDRDGIITGVLDFLADIHELRPGGGHGVDAGLGKDRLVVVDGADERLRGDVVPGRAVGSEALCKRCHAGGDSLFEVAAFHVGGQIHQIVLAKQVHDLVKTAVDDIDGVAGIDARSQDLTDIAARPVDLDGAVGMRLLKAGDRGLVDLGLRLVLRPLCPVVDHDLVAVRLGGSLVGSGFFCGLVSRGSGFSCGCVGSRRLRCLRAGSHAENHQRRKKQCKQFFHVDSSIKFFAFRTVVRRKHQRFSLLF